jgi:hypothetical protein
MFIGKGQEDRNGSGTGAVESDVFSTDYCSTRPQASVLAFILVAAGVNQDSIYHSDMTAKAMTTVWFLLWLRTPPGRTVARLCARCANAMLKKSIASVGGQATS